MHDYFEEHCLMVWKIGIVINNGGKWFSTIHIMVTEAENRMTG